MSQLEEQLRALRPGTTVTVVDVTGARFSGTVLSRRPGVDGLNEIGLRRSTSGVHWIKHDRIVALERG